MDPLSDVLSLLRPKSYVSGGFAIHGDLAIQYPRHEGIKCYAVLSGEFWIRVEGVCEPLLLRAGDCFLLPRGLPFCLAGDLSLQPVDFFELRDSGRWTAGGRKEGSTAFVAGGHFLLTGSHADILLQSLPPIVHIRKESDKAVMRWSLDRMREELLDPQPGGSLIMQQLAYMMLVQALRLHLVDGARHGEEGTGWLFALADKQMSAAIAAMHEAPGRPWTLQALAERVGMSRSVFAERFREKVGKTPMEYLTRWRMVLAGERLKNSDDSLATIAASLGYESDSAFGKAFRRIMGCSPRQHCRGEGAKPAASRPLDGLKRTEQDSGATHQVLR